MQGFTGQMLRFGWDTFQKRGWYFAGVTIFIGLISGIASQLGNYVQNAQGTALVVGLVFLFVSAVAQIFIRMGTINFSLKANDSTETVCLRDLWAPETFWNFFLASVVVGVVVVVGIILLVVPGIIWALRYLFVPYLVVDRKLGVMESLRESARITTGHKWQLLLLLLALIIVNIAGAILILVGLLVSVPVSMFAVAHAYRTLEHSASEVAAPAAA